MKKASNVLTNFIHILFAVMVAIAIILDVFVAERVTYFAKKSFILPEIVMLIIAAAMIANVAFLLRSRNSANQSNKWINMASVLLFLLLLYISLSIYFIPGWDAGGVLDHAKQLIYNVIPDGEYYSIYPNQRMILLVEYFICRVNYYFGVLDSRDGLMMIVLVQCILFAATGRILYAVIRDLLGNVYMAWAGWTLYCLMFAISGWVVVPYTDALGVIFPVLIFRIYQLISEDNRPVRFAGWAAIAVLSYFGYKLKPMILVAAIAIVISELLSLAGELDKSKAKKRLINVAFVALIFIVVFAFSSSVFTKAFARTGIVVDDNKNLGAMHMVMMGLNYGRDGSYLWDDVKMSKSIADPDERKTAQIQVIKERMNSYGFAGFMWHLARKAMVDFNDGSFAWGIEGDFYNVVLEEKNGIMCPRLRDFFYHTGDNYKYLLLVEQILWLGTLILMSLCAFIKKNKLNTALTTASIGMFLFVLIFEARARYLIVFIPIFIVVAINGLDFICSGLNKSIKEKNI